MSVQNLQDYTFYTKYAQYRPELRRRETFPEAVERVVDMHRIKYSHVNIDYELSQIKDAILEQRVLGSQRALQFGGKPILIKNARIYNCSASFCDRPRFFQEAMWLLLCGCGVGFSVQRHHVQRLPKLIRPSNEKKTFVIPDSIEGWADALGVLLSSFFVENQPFPEYFGYTVEFDYSLIRPAGSLLSSGVGRAPGPKPLENSLNSIRQLLYRLTESNREISLRPIDAYDIVMHASNAVLSGGVRRSATICIFSADDYEMAAAKVGNWFIENPQRARSNNSALLLRNQVTREEFARLFKSTKEFGEPGFVWADSTEIVFNPCCEISLYPVDIESGESGWQFCNLCEINGKKCTNRDEFLEAARIASLIGTLQAGYTKLDYLGPVSERITEREALLGVSITGIMDSPKVLLDESNLIDGAKIVVQTNKEFAKKIGIRQAARCTCIKPAGTTSCLLGTASGIHPHHARRYFRRVQANCLEYAYQYYKAYNPHSVEISVWNPNKTDGVITFCIEAEEDAITKDMMSSVEFLNIVKKVQQTWVKFGTNKELCVKPYLHHNVSNTVLVQDKEWDIVEDIIYKYREFYTGISLIGASGDIDYPQAPFTAVLTADEIISRYGSGAFMVVDLVRSACSIFPADSPTASLWNACECVFGRGHLSVENNDLLQKQNVWIQEVKEIASKYFSSLKDCIHCMKHIYNLRMWEAITKSVVPIRYSEILEDSDVKLQEIVACAGGACNLT